VSLVFCKRPGYAARSNANCYQQFRFRDKYFPVDIKMITCDIRGRFACYLFLETAFFYMNCHFHVGAPRWEGFNTVPSRQVFLSLFFSEFVYHEHGFLVCNATFPRNILTPASGWIMCCIIRETQNLRPSTFFRNKRVNVSASLHSYIAFHLSVMYLFVN
jgi:hypothetical protein